MEVPAEESWSIGLILLLLLQHVSLTLVERKKEKFNGSALKLRWQKHTCYAKDTLAYRTVV